ncbi:MAG TPA: GGDEF domain-containing protein [Burkholderiaceae bacterium]|nr:GGDEF domain-containing protein [Burkholderiaceae bacterium]
MGYLNRAGHEPPRPPGIRRILVVGLCALAMVALAIGASLFELRHNREVQHQYENSMALTQLAFDAESLASRMRALQQLVVPDTSAPAAGESALREAVRSLDADTAEWEQRIHDTKSRDVPDETKEQLARLQAAIQALRTASRPGAGASAAAESAYLSAVEAAQAALVGSTRATVDRGRIAGHTVSEVAAAAVVAASGLALVLGAVVAALVNRAQHESRATLGVMGEMLRTDPLTGIGNRRSLDENLPVEMARARRMGTALTLAMLDLDFFKRYNSRRGHAGGDSLLRAASQSWRKQLRPTDTLVRYGGEEFTLLLPNCAADQACQLIERLRPAVPDNQTFSAGVATWDQQESGEDLLRRADQALLIAKKQGRNRTIVSGREEQISLPLSSA